MWSITEENPWNIQSIYDLRYFNCPSCNYKDYSKQEFVNHAYNVHPEAYPYLNNIKDGSIDDLITPNDDAMLDLKPNLSSPYDSGLDIKIEEFDVDQEMDQNNLKTEKNDSEDQEINCDPCSFTFDDDNPDSKSSIILQDGHLEKQEEIFHCNQCLEEFPDKLKLKLHIRKVHGTGKNNEKLDAKNTIKCEKCRKVYHGKTTYLKHVGLMHQEGSFMCESCGKEFVTKHELMSHDKHVHGWKKEAIACKICGKVLKKPAMKMHISSVHEKNKNWVCVTCGKAFAEKSSLTKHEVVHTGIRKLQCSKCEQKFSQQQKLKLHVEAVHEGRKDHQCTSCGKSFGAANTLLRHRQTVHEGVKKFKCNLCTNAYGQSHELKKHLISFHKKIIPKNKNIFEIQNEMT